MLLQVVHHFLAAVPGLALALALTGEAGGRREKEEGKTPSEPRTQGSGRGTGRRGRLSVWSVRVWRGVRRWFRGAAVCGRGGQRA